MEAPGSPLHELGRPDDPDRLERLLPLTDTRFTPEYLAGHPADQALASLVAARGPGDEPQIGGTAASASSCWPTVPTT